MLPSIDFPKKFPVIQTERLDLTSLSFLDAENFYQLRSNVEFIKYLGIYPLKSISDAEEHIEKLLYNYQLKNGLSWKISLKSSRNLIGYVGYWTIDYQHFNAEIGFGLHPQYQGKGIMSEAIKAIVNFGFEKLGLHSIKANVDQYNKASIQLLINNNFRKEAHFRENYFFDGEFIDSLFYCIIKSDWKKAE